MAPLAPASVPDMRLDDDEEGADVTADEEAWPLWVAASGFEEAWPLWVAASGVALPYRWQPYEHTLAACIMPLIARIEGAEEGHHDDLH